MRKLKYAFGLNKAKVTSFFKDTLKQAFNRATPRNFRKTLKKFKKFNNGQLSKRQQENLLKSNSNLIINGKNTRLFEKTKINKTGNKRLNKNTLDKLKDVLSKRDVADIKTATDKYKKNLKKIKENYKKNYIIMSSVEIDKVNEVIEIFRTGGGPEQFSERYPDDYERLCDYAGLHYDFLVPDYFEKKEKK